MLAVSGLALAYAALVGWAMWSDCRTLNIPNTVSVGLLALFLPAALAGGLAWGDIGLHFAVGGAVLGLGIGVFALGIMGGGDIKFMAAVSVWIGWPGVMGFILLVAVLGGVLALLALVLKRYSRRIGGLSRLPWLSPDATENAIPYGIAIGLAALHGLFLSPGRMLPGVGF